MMMSRRTRVGENTKNQMSYSSFELTSCDCQGCGMSRHAWAGRGDGDDRLLGEAVLPLLQSLAAAEDVRPVLRARFNMPHWFKVQGVSLAETRTPASARTSPLGAPPNPLPREAAESLDATALFVLLHCRLCRGSSCTCPGL